MLGKNANLLPLIVLVTVVVLAALLGGGLKHGFGGAVAHFGNSAKVEKIFSIPAKRATHILVGDETGGGHKHGLGFPGKTEFPKNWDDKKIIDMADAIANDPKLPMRQSGRYWLKMKEVDGIQVRVVLDKRVNEVVTAYPLNLPRNPR